MSKTKTASGDEAPPAPNTTRWKCVCAYDGTTFAGWQSQRGGRAIQDVIEARVKTLFGELLRIHSSGRTDSGVHAHAQIFHFDAAWRHGPERLRAALQDGLPATIQIKSVHPAASDFHSRFSATGKRYTYHLFLGEADPFTRPYSWAIQREQPLDFAAMKAGAVILRGRHDFRAFSALNGPPKEDTVRDLRRIELVRHGRRVRITVEADGFMYKMVRCLVGALISVGERKLDADGLRALLTSGIRTTLVQTAPPQGLFLEKVFY